MIKVAKGTTLAGLWGLLPKDAEEALLDLEYDGRKGEQTATVKGVGRVVSWLDECSEGADRGGYVKWAKLLDVLDYDDEPLVLEGETDGSEFLFSGRCTKLF